MPRLLVPVALAALAFLAAAHALRGVVPLPDDHDLARRMEALAAAQPPFQLAFLGPSTARCAFDPRVVDEALARRGHAVRSLNLGVPGATSFEIDHLAELVAERPPPGLRWLVIELHPAEPTQLVRPGNHYTDRAVYWHTPRQTADVAALLLAPPRGRPPRPDRAWLHLRHALWRVASVGQADRALAHAARGAPGALGPRRGFAPEDCREGPRMAEARARYLAEADAVRRRMERLDRENATPVPIVHLQPEKVRRQVARLRAAGIEPVYVLSPILSPVPGIHGLRRAGVLPTLLAFDSPTRHPELYAPALRQDDLHLNEAGAERFSRQFAERFARWLETGREG